MQRKIKQSNQSLRALAKQSKSIFILNKDCFARARNDARDKSNSVKLTSVCTEITKEIINSSALHSRSGGNSLTKRNISYQKGVSIIAAIFMITVLALLATAAVQIVTTGQQSLSQEITSVKAYFAGQTGLQWGMYQAVYASPSATQTITLSNSGLSNTTVAVSFSSSSIDGNTYYVIDSNGQYSDSNSPEYSLRHLRLRFKP